MLATGGRVGRSSQKNFPDIPKKFSGYTTFLPKYEKNFPDIPKNFSDKKCNLNDIFHARKGHFAPGKRALGKT
jgi:hypothetical protein